MQQFLKAPIAKQEHDINKNHFQYLVKATNKCLVCSNIFVKEN